jgi:hypothetical protein
MARPVNTVASGGLAVVDVTATMPQFGFPVSEALPGQGLAVTKVANFGKAVTFVASSGTFIALSSNTVAENATIGTTVGTLSVVNPGTGTPVYTLTDSAGGKFSITGALLKTAAALDYETATSHLVTVHVTGLTPPVTDQVILVVVTDIDDTAPVITSGSTVSNVENTPLAFTLTANETVTWSIVGGADQARFELSGSTLRWASNGTKDFETPDDADTNNAYIVQVRATDLASLTTNQTITVTVTDVFEAGTTTVITQDGLDATFAGLRTTGQYVDGSWWIVAPPGGVVLNSVAIHAGVTTDVYLGGVMVEPAGLATQGFDNRYGSGIGPGLIYDGALAKTLPLTVDHYADGTSSPKTIWLYRGLDTVQSGGANSGCAYIVQITVVASSPASNTIKPTGFLVAGGKPTTTQADINYSAITPLAIPSGAVEPDWSYQTLFIRPTIQSGEFNTGHQINLVSPTYSQESYPAYQSGNAALVLLGAISTSTSRTMLIDRIVRQGLDWYAQSLYNKPCCIAGAGFGQGLAPVVFMAGVFLNNSAMKTTPAPVAIYTGQTVPYYQEHGAVFIGTATGPYPYGQPIYGVISSAAYPAGPFGDNHDQRDVTGAREPHWLTHSSGTARAGAASWIQLASGAPSTSGYENYVLYLASGPGAGDARRIVGGFITLGSISGTALTITFIDTNPISRPNPIRLGMTISGTGITAGTYIVSQSSGTTGGTGTYVISPSHGTVSPPSILFAGYDQTTKRAAMYTDFTTPPTSSTTYEFYNGGEYQTLATQYNVGCAVAIVAAGLSAQWQAFDTSGAWLFYIKRWIDMQGELNPRKPEAYDQSQYYIDIRSFNDIGGVWAKKFYLSYAQSIWPAQTSETITPGSLPIVGQTITPVFSTAGGPTTVFQTTLTGATIPGLSGTTMRQVTGAANLSAATGQQIRITIGFPLLGAGATIICYVGQGSTGGDQYDTTAMVQLTGGDFGSGTYTQAVTNPATLVSDWCTLNEAYDEAKDLVIAFYGAVAGVSIFTGVTNAIDHVWYVGGNTASVANATGYTDGDAFNSVFVAKIEIKT